MKTSQILASLFFGSLAAAVPINQRDLVTKTEMVLETVVVYTTVWDDEPVAEATTTAAAFYEQPAPSVEAKPTTTAAVTTSAAVETPVSVYTPPVQTPSPQPAPVTQAAAPQPEAPKPETQAAPKPETSAAPAPKPETTTQAAPAPTTTEVAYTPAPAPSSAPAPQETTDSYSSGGASGESGSNVDITIYNPGGAYGACGVELSDDQMVAAIAAPAWGVSSTDVMTGKSTNKWCGQKVKATYEGRTAEFTIMDVCPGCSGMDLDLSPAAWRALTGTDEITRHHGVSWTTV